MNLEEVVWKEINKVNKILENVIFVDLKAKRIFELINSYFEDAKYFLNKKDFLNAFEAVVICWAYLDCLANLGFLRITDEVKQLLTI